MALSKLDITGYKDGLFSDKNGDKFTVMINPANFDHSHSITYSEEGAQGTAAKTTKFKAVGPESVSINFILDDTGAVPRNEANTGKSVTDMILALKMSCTPTTVKHTKQIL